MEFINNRLFNYLKTNTPKGLLDRSDFISYNQKVLFERIRIVSLMLIFTYPCFFYVDFFLFNNVPSQAYKFTLTSVHFAGMLISLLFILFYKFQKKRPTFTKKAHYLVNFYIFLYLFIGAISSVNSQLLTGNINAYVIILFAVGSLFPIQPKNIILMIACNHLIFLFGLWMLEKDRYLILTKLINSTGTAVIAFTIAYAFFTYRKNDYINRQKLIKNEENFRSLFNINPYPLILTTIADHKIKLINHQAIGFYQLQGKNVIGMNTDFIFGDEDKQKVINRLLEEQSVHNYLMPYHASSNQPRWTMMNFELINYSGSECMLIGVADVTNFKKTEEELVKHASVDLLTGVLNRRKGHEIIQNLIEQSEEFVVCFIDINNLKKVNDTYGHSVGDELINTVCQTVNKKLDQHDALFRLGGDEFIIIFQRKSMVEIEHIWDEIQMEFQIFNQSKQKKYPISASHGYYHYQPSTNITVEEILEQADQEMYKDKIIYKSKNPNFNAAAHLF